MPSSVPLTSTSGADAVPAVSLKVTVGSLVRLAVMLPPLQLGVTVVWSIVRVFGGTALVVALVQEQLEPPTVMLPSTRPVAAKAGAARSRLPATAAIPTSRRVAFMWSSYCVSGLRRLVRRRDLGNAWLTTGLGLDHRI